MRKTSEFFRKLSLKAEKNWVQNRGAKRRVISRDEDMTISGGSIGRLAAPTGSGPRGDRRGRSAQFKGQVTTAVSDDSQVAGSREDNPGGKAASTGGGRVSGMAGRTARTRKRAARGCPLFKSPHVNPLPAEGPPFRRLHQHRCYAEGNGSRRGECEPRYPHGAIPPLGSAAIANRARSQRWTDHSVPGTPPNL